MSSAEVDRVPLPLERNTLESDAFQPSSLSKENREVIPLWLEANCSQLTI